MYQLQLQQNICISYIYSISYSYSVSVTLIQVAPPGYFVYVSITTPIVSALKKLL